MHTSLTAAERKALRTVQVRHGGRMLRLFVDYALGRHPGVTCLLCFSVGLLLGLVVALTVALH